MDLRLVLGQHPSLIIIGSTATTFKRTDLGEAMSIGATSSTITDHDSYIEVRKASQYGTCSDSYIERPKTSYDASRYRYGIGFGT